MAKIIDVPAEVELSENSKVRFQDWLLMAMDQYKPFGKGFKAVRQANKIADLIESANGSVRFEDSDYEVLKAAVEEAQFVPGAARRLAPFFQAVEEAQDVKG